jgi:transglutaminase-like putative cysteine protease
MIARLFRRFSAADVIAFTLIVTALNILAYGISVSLRDTDTKYFYSTCMTAALVGLGLSRIKCNGIQSSAWIVALGVLGVWIIGASLTAPLINFGRVAFSILPQMIPAIHLKIPIDTTPMKDAWYPIAQSSAVLWMRLQTWLVGLNHHAAINDALIRNMVWLLILWYVSAWVGWFMRKRNAVLTLMPPLLLLALVTSYSERKVESLWMMVCMLLLLMGVWSYKNHTHQWERQKVDFSESISFDVTQAVIFVSMLIATLAFITPSISWREIRDYLRERNQTSENETAEMLGIQQPVGPAKNVAPQKPSLPRDHLLSGGFATSQKIVMIIKTGELSPLPSSTIPVAPPRHYWRSVTYDIYVGAGWETSSAPSQTIQPNMPLISGLLTGYKLLHMDVEIIEPEGKLFWSGMLYSANVPFTANWRVRPQSNPFADQSALLQSDMFAASAKATRFKVDAYIPIVTIDELRAATTEYPNDIARRYVALPQSVPERVHALARQITKGLDNPYDKAKAIESYLRANYPYDLNIPTPPEDRDVADYFLFDLKKGYCDYYATAMVVLARSSGLPARFVSGYAPGSYDTSNAEYIVREMHAHSWAEIYFPEIGWVEFEPTASEPEIQRARPEDVAAAVQESQSSTRRLLIRFHLEKAIYWVMPLGSAIALFILYFALIEKWIYLRLAPIPAIEKIYRRFYRLGRPLAGERTRAETAYEFITKLSNKVDVMSADSRFVKLLSVLQNEAITLANLYQSTLFVNRRPEKKDARLAWQSWKGLRWRLLLARILLFIASRKSQVNRMWLKEE